MKKLSVIALLLALVMVFAGCNIIEVNQERDMERVVIKVGDETIQKQAYVDAYNAVAYQSGLTKEQLKEAEIANKVQEYAIEQVVTDKIVKIKARQYECYEFTQEELDEMNSSVDEMLSYYREIAKNKVKGLEENKDKTDEELADQIDQEYKTLLENMSFDEEAYRDRVKDQKAAAKLYEEVTKIDPITEGELQSEYDKKVVEQRTGNQDGNIDIESLLNNGTTVYYNPADIRTARHILVAIPQDMRTKIYNLNQSGDTEEADKILKEELAKIVDKANDVYKQLEEGKDFNELLAEVGEDPGMKEDNVYYVSKDTKTFVKEFADGLFAIENKDEYSKPVETELGYHIVLYVDDVVEGAVPFEDVKETIETELSSTKKQAMYAEQMETWKNEIKTKVYKSNLKYTIE